MCLKLKGFHLVLYSAQRYQQLVSVPKCQHTRSLPVESSLAPGECFLFHISCAQQTTEVVAVWRTRIAGGHPPQSRISQSTLRITRARRMIWNDSWFIVSVARCSTVSIVLLFDGPVMSCGTAVVCWADVNCRVAYHNARVFFSVFCALATLPAVEGVSYFWLFF